MRAFKASLVIRDSISWEKLHRVHCLLARPAFLLSSCKRHRFRDFTIVLSLQRSLTSKTSSSSSINISKPQHKEGLRKIQLTHSYLFTLASIQDIQTKSIRGLIETNLHQNQMIWWLNQNTKIASFSTWMVKKLIFNTIKPYRTNKRQNGLPLRRSDQRKRKCEIKKKNPKWRREKCRLRLKLREDEGER